MQIIKKLTPQLIIIQDIKIKIFLNSGLKTSGTETSREMVLYCGGLDNFSRKDNMYQNIHQSPPTIYTSSRENRYIKQQYINNKEKLIL